MDVKWSVDEKKKAPIVLLMAAIIITALNLRAAITSIGPLLGFIREDINIQYAASGFLTTLILLTFAVISAVASSIGKKIGQREALVAGLALLLLGIILRTLPNIWFLFGGSIAIGIAICNVLLPSIIKMSFPFKVGLMTSIYTTCMIVAASAASGISVPLAVNGAGWEGALLIWCIPALAGVCLWALIIKSRLPVVSQAVQQTEKTVTVWTSPLAWAVSLFMGFQSIGYYTAITWFPDILAGTGGVSIAYAGWMVALMQLSSLPTAFLVPILAEKYRNQIGIVLMTALLGIGSLSILIMASGLTAVTVGVIGVGLCSGGKYQLIFSIYRLSFFYSRQGRGTIRHGTGGRLFLSCRWSVFSRVFI